MRFLEANRAIKSLGDDVEHRTITLMSSFQSEPLNIYLQAHFATNNIKASISHLPFGTLQQFIRAEHNEACIAILTPWDFLPELDWRMGYSPHILNYEACLHTIHRNAQFIANKVSVAVYAAILGKPIFNRQKINQAIHAEIMHALNKYSIRHDVMSCFDLDLYLESGQLCRGKSVAGIAKVLVSSYLQRPMNYKKILVTDLDNTLWYGVIGEDGLEGIEYSPEGRGYRHYLYQSLLKSLKERGVLLAVVSKNDKDLANQPFLKNNMQLNELDMVVILASYEAKSSQINSIAKQLNLPLDAFVFVDDNPVELAEVKTAFPDITCIPFYTVHEKFEAMLSEIQRLFPQASLSEEDKQRTNMYKARLKFQRLASSEGADVTEFLRSLDMALSIKELSLNDCQRAIQLLNKTNQFNINGYRLSDSDVNSLAFSGGRIFSASLADKHGSHGEILTCIVTDNCFKYFAMSCRVLKRHVEFACIHKLCEILDLPNVEIAYVETERNTPVKNFLGELFLGGSLVASQKTLISKTAKYASLFTVNIELIKP